MQKYHVQFPFAKGPITYCLDQISVGPNARQAMERLKKAIEGLEGIGYHGLEKAFEIHLTQPVYADATRSSRVTAYLTKHWFDASSPDAYFPEFQPIAEIYATGVIKALEESLKGKPDPIPIDAWWILDYPDVELMTLVSPRQVTLVIATPRPAGPVSSALWGEDAAAWATGRFGIQTRRLPYRGK